MNEQISRLSNILELTNQIDRNQELWCLEDLDQDSILSHQRELDKSQLLNKLASFNFNEIELDCECEPDPQLCDLIPNFESMLTLVSLSSLDHFPEPTFIPIPIDLEIDSPILDSQIPFMGKNCEFQFLNLNSTLEPKLTLEPKVNFSS